MDAIKRKAIPLATGCIDYFPDALAAVADLSRVGGEQHNPGQPLFWDKTKSTDHSDALMRHFLERGTLDVDGVRHCAKVAWRALAMLQTEIEKASVATTQHATTEHLRQAVNRFNRLNATGTVPEFSREWFLGELSTHPMAAEILRAEDDLDTTGVCS
jgi:hypothetical protein